MKEKSWIFVLQESILNTKVVSIRTELDKDRRLFSCLLRSFTCTNYSKVCAAKSRELTSAICVLKSIGSEDNTEKMSRRILYKIITHLSMSAVHKYLKTSKLQIPTSLMLAHVCMYVCVCVCNIHGCSLRRFYQLFAFFSSQTSLLFT